MREIRQSGSEGGGELWLSPYPYPAARGAVDVAACLLDPASGAGDRVSGTGFQALVAGFGAAGSRFP